ncbi:MULTISPECIES: antitoxin of toxin-antitoxin stability system [Asticcacaulis]|uniref:antitoxin of toxin-antitoxin stability system n=1 Tax=Asticcacaulis TaxID=76890 RepID=UPI001AEB9267|nr:MULTISPECIES: antitoxin of toxin-antitoxin stability system [Asticcacaulis]MBP2161099.1 putative transcriptional regulator [Asticcacaulis solisilvae]MDR6802144.1 putative transcriptional regulator [Asticcacaulis sp. BE141]
MSKEAVFTLKLEADLRDAFMKEAAESHRPASQIVRDFMREFVKKQQEQRAYDEWLDADLDRAIKAADDPNTKWIPHEEVVADMERQRQSLLKRLAENPDAE